MIADNSTYKGTGVVDYDGQTVTYSGSQPVTVDTTDWADGYGTEMPTPEPEPKQSEEAIEEAPVNDRREVNVDNKARSQRHRIMPFRYPVGFV